MATYLLKTEPSTYSFADLVAAKKATWDGVKNPVAQQHIRAAKKGDLAVIYHTGDEKAAVGLARITSGGHADPNDPSGKLAVFDLAPVKALAQPVTLAQLKANLAFADSPLVKVGRLSVVPLDDKQLAVLLGLGKTTV
jgi:predicted RNA-binding protein with PUA-like domain